MKIQGKELTESDKGREVVYTAGHGTKEFGHISSWNGHFVFVKYGYNQQSQATRPENLVFGSQ